MLKPLIEILGRRWKQAAVALAAPLTCIAGVATSLPDLYRATASVLVQQESIPGALAQAGDVETRFRTIREEILSRKRLDEMITKFGLYPELRSRAPREAIIDRMRRDIHIQPRSMEAGGGPGGTIAFSLSYQARHRAMAALVANTLADSYIEENLRIRGRQAKGTAAALEAQLAEIRQRLEQQETQLDRFRALHAGELPQQVGTNLATLDHLSTQLQMNRDSLRRTLERREGLARLASETGLTDLAVGSETEGTRLARLKQELAVLQGTYSDKYPDVLRLKEQIAALERGMADAPAARKPAARESQSPRGPAVPRLRRELDNADAEIRTLTAEEKRLRQEIEAYRARIEVTPQREQEFSELSRDYETTRELYLSLLKRYEEARLADDLERTGDAQQLRILDQAIPPALPIAPNRLRLMLAGLMLSAVMSVGAVALLEQMDTSFHSVDDLRAFTRIPVLVSIPPLVTRGDRWRRRWLFLAWSVVTVAGLALIGAASYTFGRGNEELVRMLSRGVVS